MGVGVALGTRLEGEVPRDYLMCPTVENTAETLHDIKIVKGVELIKKIYLLVSS